MTGPPLAERLVMNMRTNPKGEDLVKTSLEEQFRQAQKMAVVGHLVGGVAHDFNNIIAMIALQANVARIRAQRDEERKAFMDIEDSAKHAAALTRRLLRFSRKQAVDMKPLDVNAVVHDLAELLRRLLGQDVRVQLSLHPMPLVADADATMLDQLLMNLAVNARDAMPAGGWLIIETSALVVSAEDELARLAPGEYVCLRVSDCGCGIAKDDLARIFDPFFTTKGSEHGTGLGLATVRMIVEQHRGAIDVSSELGAGTSFRVLLPRG